MMWCAIYLCCLVVAGYPIVAALANNRASLETFGLSACLGAGVIGISLIFLSMLGQRPARNEILLLTTPFAAAAIVYLCRKRTRVPQTVPRYTTLQKWWMGFCLLAIVYGLVSVGIDALVYPILEWDAFAIWQLKAKALALWPLRPPPPYFQNVSLSFSHLRYPILVPMISAGVDAMIGTFDDLAKSPALLLYAALGAVVYATLRRARGRIPAITATALLMSVFPMLRYAGSGTAEMALTAFYGCGIVCLLRWQEQRHWGDLILVALFSACMAWTKNEGLALAAINAVVLLTMTPGSWRRAIDATAAMLAITAILYVPWTFYIRAIPRTDENYAARLNPHEILANLHRIPEILAGIGREFITWNNWGALWIVLLALLILQWRQFRSPPVRMLGLLLLLHLLAYIPPYMVTNWKLSELLRVTTDRLLLHATPPAALLIGFLWPAWVGRDGLPPPHSAAPSPNQ